tara:strand:- start:420 stop:1334 length:915 start_codon:yes stop_codon:yes gene_type:complete
MGTGYYKTLLEGARNGLEEVFESLSNDKTKKPTTSDEADFRLQNKRTYSDVKQIQMDRSRLPGLVSPRIKSGVETNEDSMSILDRAYAQTRNQNKILMSELEARQGSRTTDDPEGTVSNTSVDIASSLPASLLGSKGSLKGDVASQSYFNKPLSGNFASFSRAAGDTTKEEKQKVINLIVGTGRQAGMSEREIAYTLATASVESGFNPEAAAHESSASGIGQFVNLTGKSYNINKDTRWNLEAQVQALVDHTVDNIAMAKQKGLGEEYIYALHHDGPKLNRDGLSISREKVMPLVDKYLKYLTK